MTPSLRAGLLTIFAALGRVELAEAQVPPTPAEIARYTGLHAAAAAGDVDAITRIAAGGADLNARDGHGRTPLHVAAHARSVEAAHALLHGGADVNALDGQRYDVVTITAVNGHLDMLKLVLEHGADPKLVTSPYDGTALIAAAHAGTVDIVRALIAAGAPLDHVNNLGWTALIEAVILGDGGPAHTEIVRLLLAAGASPHIADRQGRTPLALARQRGYGHLAEMIAAAGGRD